MSPFSGFPKGKQHLTPIPSQFFTELLPEMDSLFELKVSLLCMWILSQQDGPIRFITCDDFTDDELIMKSLGSSREEALENLSDALELAAQRGFLLKACITENDEETIYYFLNSSRGRSAIEGLEKQKWSPKDINHAHVKLEVERPNIYRLYEENIGPLTPLMADALRDAEALYPPERIEEAFQIAVENNVRKWRYVEAILKSWQEEGRDGIDRRDTEENRRRYLKGEFSDLIEH